jgi:serine/threonine protein kinase
MKGIEHRSVLVELRRLLDKSEERFNANVTELYRYLENQNTEHIVDLLARFKYRDQFHLLTLWPSMDWATYTKNNAQPNLTQDFILWFAVQWEGISNVVHCVHQYEIDVIKPKGIQNFGRFPSPDPASNYWLDPSDIVLFSPKEPNTINTSTSEAGILQIRVYGRFPTSSSLRGFHSSSMNANASSLEYSPYWAPEQIFDERPLDGSSDVWTLGCVLLEAVTWLLSGAKAVTEFAELRNFEKISLPQIMHDYYTEFSEFFFWFDLERQVAQLKPSAAGWIKKLREHPKCTQYLWELLGLIEDKMLQVDCKMRIRLQDLTLRLRQMRERLSVDQNYSVRPRRHGLLGKLKLGKGK